MKLDQGELDKLQKKLKLLNQDISGYFHRLQCFSQERVGPNYDPTVRDIQHLQQITTSMASLWYARRELLDLCEDIGIKNEVLGTDSPLSQLGRLDT